MKKKIVAILFLAYVTTVSIALAKQDDSLRSRGSRSKKMQTTFPEIQELLDGNKKFRHKFFGKDRGLFDQLIHKQEPKIMIIGCSDSRVDPSVVFKCKPGQFFAVRNIANLVPPSQSNSSYHGTSAALEYGVTVLGVKHVILFGHTRCGGIKTLVEQAIPLKDNPESFIAKWLELAQPAYDRIMAEHAGDALEDQITLCERYSLINSLKNLMSFSWIKERVNAGKLFLHAWYIDLPTGGIYCYDQNSDQWLFN